MGRYGVVSYVRFVVNLLELQSSTTQLAERHHTAENGECRFRCTNAHDFSLMMQSFVFFACTTSMKSL